MNGWLEILPLVINLSVTLEGHCVLEYISNSSMLLSNLDCSVAVL
jgi:hypothetical protein